jgi:hypothetical protein
MGIELTGGAPVPGAPVPGAPVPDPAALECHPAGRAFLVCPAGGPDSRLIALAANLADDPEHTVVVVDLDTGDPGPAWDPVAAALAARPGPGRLRLVPARPALTTTVRTGQWLADRLGCPVLANDGPALLASRGAMFVPPEAGPGWLLLQPGEPAAVASRHFPTPDWATAVPDAPAQLSATATAEPLPAGAWIRPADADAGGLAEHRRWLCHRLARRSDQCIVALGHPGAPPVPPTDVVRFWELLPVAARPAVRFVSYGPSPAPGGPALGQVLADLLGHHVVVAAGLPVSGWRAADETEVHTLCPDGSFGWRPFALELGYLPRAWAGEYLPSVVSHRPPIAGLPELSPRVYGYASGVVLEVVQSGLWLRAAAEGPGAAVIRGRPADPAHPVIFYDTELRDAAGEPQPLAELAAEVVLALDPELRELCELVAVTPPDRPARMPEVPVPVAADPAVASQVPAPGPPAAGSGPAPAMPVTPPDPVPAAAPAAPASPAPAPATPPARAALPSIRLESGGGIGQRDAATALARPAMDLDAALLPAEAAGPAPEPEPAGTTTRPPADLPQPAEPQAETPPAPGAADPPPATVRVQPVPRPEASVIPPERGIARERTWLRQAMSQEYDAAANSVMRVLSETPGLRGDAQTSPDLLTDLVAARLYLTGEPQQIDDAVRAGQVGPHVPFGRCVTAGLRRLPSYRGATRVRATLADDEWQWYDGRQLVTEWAFFPALAAGQPPLTGAVEFLIWSMTARRANLLEPSVRSQVIFLPGTNFKVLRVRAGDRREVLLRELSASEIDADGQVEAGRVALDEIALNGLERVSVSWRQAAAGEELPARYSRRFTSPPGLIALAGAGVADLPAGGGTPAAAAL